MPSTFFFFFKKYTYTHEKSIALSDQETTLDLGKTPAFDGVFFSKCLTGHTRTQMEYGWILTTLNLLVKLIIQADNTQ